MLTLWFALVVCTAILAGIYRHFAKRGGLVDQPTGRSSHQQPTVTGAGIVMAVVFGSLLLFLRYSVAIDALTFYSSTLIVSISLIGWLDDRRTLSVRLRFAIYAVYALASVILIGVQPWFTAIAAALFVFAYVNSFNFMDGIDGLALCQLIFVCTSAAFLIHLNGGSELIALCCGLTAIGVGALLWNWSPAKLFLGDAGSIFLGLMLAIFAVFSAQEGSLQFTTWLILSALFICDSAVTLLCRLFAGAKIYQPHRTHLYQLLSQRAGGHAFVVIAYMMINLLFLLPLAVLAEHDPLRCYYYLVFAYGLLSIIVYNLRTTLLRGIAHNLSNQ